jgi:octaprenyl-diphosphate synthase
MLVSFKAVGGEDIKDIVPLAAAFELIHTATLIHDDINDGSDRRRGKLAVHKKFGTRNALIAGDFLFAKAFEIGTLFGKDVIKVASEASTKLAEGEILQTKNLFDVFMDMTTYLRIIECKTAVPFAAGAKVGGMIGGGSEQEISALESFGLNFGLAFQITDDILDTMGDTKRLGKPVGMDIVEGKMTAMTLFALRNLDEGDKQSLKKILIKERKKRADVKAALELIKSSGAKELAFELASHYVDRAKVDLNDISNDIARRQLEFYADNLINRKS